MGHKPRALAEDARPAASLAQILAGKARRDQLATRKVRARQRPDIGRGSDPEPAAQYGSRLGIALAQENRPVASSAQGELEAADAGEKPQRLKPGPASVLTW